MFQLTKTISVSILLWCAIIYFNSAFAENLKITYPTFKGYVFKNYNSAPVEEVRSNSDNCSIRYSTLKIKDGVTINFSNLSEYQKYLQSILPPHANCTIDIIEEHHQVNFDSGYALVLYNSIFFNVEAYQDLKLKPSYHAHAFCKSNILGQSDYENYFPGIEPIYLCPEGSQFFDDNVCVPISDENCSGDIVARELATSFPIIKDQGHVGIVIQGISEDHKYIVPYIIEVLDEPGVIKINTMDDFYNRVRFCRKFFTKRVWPFFRRNYAASV
jgi:hypothetical protein